MRCCSQPERHAAEVPHLPTQLSACSAIIETLEEISLNRGKSWNAESTTKAAGLYRAIGNFEFLLPLAVARKTLAFTNGVTVKLQSRSIDVMRSFQDIKSIQEVMNHLRDDLDKYIPQGMS